MAGYTHDVKCIACQNIFTVIQLTLLQFYFQSACGAQIQLIAFLLLPATKLGVITKACSSPERV
jgi:hypothetical protein